jgi:hypothetical protein
MGDERALLRHTLATLGYRTDKAVLGAPPAFARFAAAPGSRTAAEILAHMGDLFDWALSMARGQPQWRDSSPLPWDEEVVRFFRALEAFDAFVASDEPLALPINTLFQGPVADALTHTGQLTMLRRLAGSPVKRENFTKADIRIGSIRAQVGVPPGPTSN